ncbi:MAG: hypothetical protein ACK4VO_12235 [Pseudobdellovibrio sp.]
MEFNHSKKIIIVLIALTAFSGCMNGLSAVENSSLQATQALGCSNFKSKVFDSMYDYLDGQKSSPSLEDFISALNSQIDQIAKDQNIQDTEKVSQLKEEMAKLYETLIDRSKKLKKVQTARQHLETIIELEMQDISTTENVKLNTELAQQFSKVESIAKSTDVQCSSNQPTAPDSSNQNGQATTPPSSGSDNAQLPPQTNPDVNKKNRIIAGSKNVIATAYQSCQSLDIPEISAATPNVIGITKLKDKHQDGIGGKRIISDLKQVQNTHPYIKVAGGETNGCFNVRNNPLIYDYGGEPSVTSTTINFFKDSGTGTSVLGVDCSAYVSAAIGVAGLKYNPSVDNKPIFIRQNSSKFINANASGFKCFSNVIASPSESIRPGDIVGVRGHVVMIDKIGSDPFGLKKLKSANDCSNMKIDNFDFIVSQSSPSKNGIGINRYVVRDYLKETGPGKMQTAFIGIAQAACQAYFSQKNVPTPSQDYGIIRHKGTSECLTSQVQLANQSCVSQCRE